MQAEDVISTLVQDGLNVSSVYDGERWLCQVEEYLRLAFGEETIEDFKQRTSELSNYCDTNIFTNVRRGVGYLQGLRERQTRIVDETRVDDRVLSASQVQIDHRVFIVHGHNIEIKESVARFVERLGLQAIILHEQPSSGRTVIEKFETCSAVSFAVVLLSPDDVGAPAAEGSALQPRARQNVVFELGYFVGRLSRRRVCALYSGNVEIPSDYHGVLYVPFDREGAWRTKLAQELIEVGLPIDLSGLV